MPEPSDQLVESREDIASLNDWQTGCPQSVSQQEHELVSRI